MKLAKEMLQKVRAIFNNGEPVVPVVAAAPEPAPAVPVVTPDAHAGTTYKLLDGTEIVINQAGDVPAIGDTVMIGGVPPPEGVLTLEDNSTITVDAMGIIIQVSNAAPVTQDLSTVPAQPTLEDRVKALESKMNAPAPAPVMPTGLATEVQLQEAIKKIDKQDKVIEGLFQLVESMTQETVTEPVTLNGLKKDRFNRLPTRNDRFTKMAETLKSMKALS